MASLKPRPAGIIAVAVAVAVAAGGGAAAASVDTAVVVLLLLRWWVCKCEIVAAVALWRGGPNPTAGNRFFSKPAAEFSSNLVSKVLNIVAIANARA